MTAMCLTYYFWVRSLRGGLSWIFGVCTGLAYGYMVAAWGGYIFVVNMVALHCLLLLALGRFSWKLHHAYTLFYVIGTFLAIQVPWLPTALRLPPRRALPPRQSRGTPRAVHPARL
jgi:dolichyl-diphosphooligosaccharide--protein glycosyltransferase